MSVNRLYILVKIFKIGRKFDFSVENIWTVASTD